MVKIIPNLQKTIFLIVFICFVSGFAQNQNEPLYHPKIKELKNYIKWSISYASQKEFDSANHYTQRAMRLSKKIDNFQITAWVKLNTAIVRYWQVDIVGAKKLLEENLKNDRTHDSINILSYLSLGEIYEYEQNHTLALNNLLSAEKVIRNEPLFKEKDSMQLSYTYRQIARLHHQQKNLKKADYYYDEALKFSNKPNYNSQILFLKSELYEEGNRLNEAIDITLKAADIAIRNKEKVYLPTYYLSISERYLKLKNGDSAVFYGKIGLKNNKDCQVDLLLNRVGEGYILTKNYKKALEYFELALDQAKEETAVEIHKNARDTYIELQNYKQAIYHNDIYLRLKDSLEGLKIRQELLDITEKYESDKKELKIEMLNSKNEYNSLVIKKQQTQIFLTTILLVLLIVVLSLIVLFYFKQKRQKHLLFIKNRQLAQRLASKKETEIIVRSYQKKEVSGIDSSRKDKINDLIKRMIEDKFYLDKEMTLSKMAKIANTNTTYLSKIINEDYQKSFTNFINDLRISGTLKKLESLPEYRRLTVDHIADNAGFASSSSFYKAFKKFTGLTPSYYIKKRLQQDT